MNTELTDILPLQLIAMACTPMSGLPSGTLLERCCFPAGKESELPAVLQLILSST